MTAEPHRAFESLVVGFHSRDERDAFAKVAEAMASVITEVAHDDVRDGDPVILVLTIDEHLRTGDRPTAPMVQWVAEAARGYGALSAARAGPFISDHRLF